MMGSTQLTYTCIDTHSYKDARIHSQTHQGKDKRNLSPEEEWWRQTVDLYKNEKKEKPLSLFFSDISHLSLFTSGNRENILFKIQMRYYDHRLLSIFVLQNSKSLSVLCFCAQCALHLCVSVHVSAHARVHACLSALMALCSRVLDRSELIRPLWPICLYLEG